MFKKLKKKINKSGCLEAIKKEKNLIFKPEMNMMFGRRWKKLKETHEFFEKSQ